MLHRILAAVLLTVVYSSTMAQSADRRAGAAMNASDWFRLRKIYRTESHLMSPFLRDMAKALLDDAFNRSEEAAISIRKLLKEHRSKMGLSNIESMVYLLAANESKAGHNKKAADILRDFLQQAQNKLDSTYARMFASHERQFREMAKYAVNKVEGDLKACDIPFRIDSIGPEKKRSIQMTIPAEVNGIGCDINFDTGASVNIISPELARKCGMRMIDARSWVAGVNMVMGGVALADRVKLGNLVLRNVPFNVIKITSGNAVADQYLRHMDCVMGIPLMRVLRKVQIDFAGNRLLVSREVPAKSEPNLCMNSSNGLMQLQMEHDGDTLIVNPDTGAGHLATLYYRYFKRNAAAVTYKGARTVNSSAGVGGISVTKGYLLKDFSLGIGGISYLLPDVFISMEAESDRNIPASFDGNVGLEYFQKFKFVTFDLDHMAVSLTPY